MYRCSSILGIDDFKLVDGGTGNEGAGEAGVDAPAGCLGAGSFILCLDPAPTAELVVGQPGMQINTDGDPRCRPMQPSGWLQQGQPGACFLTGTNVRVSAGASFIGSRPVVIAALDTVTSSGLVDVAADRGATARPPGAPSALCNVSTAGMDGSGNLPGAVTVVA